MKTTDKADPVTANRHPGQTLEVVVLGSAGDFLAGVLGALQRADMTVSATFVQGFAGKPTRHANQRVPEIPVTRPSTQQPMAGFDLEFIADIHTEQAYALLAECEPDVIVTACYAQILPAPVLALPRLGCINLHPSLLPTFRGPSPLFWQFRAGVFSTGITLHRMTAQIDAGVILAQKMLPVPAGISAGQVYRTLGDLGGEALVTVLDQLARGDCEESTQAAEATTYHGWPDDDAFVLDRTWTVERVYRFMRGTREWGRRYSLVLPNTTLRLDDVLTFEPGRTIHEAWQEEAGRLLVRFADGVVVAVGDVETT